MAVIGPRDGVGPAYDADAAAGADGGIIPIPPAAAPLIGHQRRAELAGISLFTLVNQFTQETFFKPQYTTFLIHEVANKLNTELPTVSSGDDYAYHFTVQFAKTLFEACFSPIPQPLLTALLTILASPTIEYKVCQISRYQRFKAMFSAACSWLWNSLVVTPLKNKTPRIAKITTVAVLAAYAVGSDYGSGGYEAFKISFQAALSDDSDSTHQEVVWRITNLVFDKTIVGQLLKFSDTSIPAEVKIGMLQHAASNFSTQVLNRARLAIAKSEEVSERIQRTGHQVGAAEPIDPKDSGRFGEDMLDAFGFYRHFGDRVRTIARNDLLGSSIGVGTSARTTHSFFLSSSVTAVAKIAAGGAISPFGLLAGVGSDVSDLEFGIRTAGIVTSLALHTLLGDTVPRFVVNLSVKMGVEAGVLLKGSSKRHFDGRIITKRITAYAHLGMVKWNGLCDRAHSFFAQESQREAFMAKKIIKQITYSVAYWSATTTQSPIIKAVLHPHVVQVLSNGMAYWGVNEPEQPLDPISGFPIQLLLGILFTLPEMIGEPNPVALSTANLMLSIFMIPEVLREGAKNPIIKRIADKMRSFVPGLNMKERFAHALKSLDRVAHELDIPIPLWVRGLLRISSTAAVIESARQELYLPHYHHLAHHTKRIALRYLKMAIGFTSMIPTGGARMGIMSAKMEVRSGDYARLYSSFAIMILGVEMGAHELTLGGWLLPVVVIAGSEVASYSGFAPPPPRVLADRNCDSINLTSCVVLTALVTKVLADPTSITPDEALLGAATVSTVVYTNSEGISTLVEKAKDCAITAAVNVGLTMMDVAETLEPVTDAIGEVYSAGSRAISTGWNLTRQIAGAVAPRFAGLGRFYRLLA